MTLPSDPNPPQDDQDDAIDSDDFTLVSSDDTLEDPSVTSPPRKPPAGLYLVATPIGNAGDITVRALETLRGVDVVACEDTRTTGKLLRRYGISVALVPYHEHNATKMRPRLLDRIGQGQSVALVSDAGTPLISDPGYKLVREAVSSGLYVSHLPGANAALTAMVLSGQPSDRFLFLGFLPNRETARRASLVEVATVRASLITYESPQRLADMLADAVVTLDGRREAAVARELTKLFEEVRRGTLAELADHYAKAGPPKGEVVVVIGPPLAEAEATADDLDAMLLAAFRQLSLRDAAASVATATGRPRKEVYARALALGRNETNHGPDDDPSA